MSNEFWPGSTVGESVPKSERKKLDAEVQYILLQFEKPKEWADLTNCLIRLYRIIKQSTISEIPHKETICKRLAQCLNPLLPSGVHTRALEVYGSILEKAGPEGLSKDLALFSSGLFPFFTYSSISVRPIFLSLIEQYYIPLGKKLLPCLMGLLICILPGLEDEKSETYGKVYQTLERISDCVSERSFMQALWLILLKASKIRLPTLCVIAIKLSPGMSLLPPERVDVLLPRRHVLVIKSLEATSEDESLLVLRELINLLVKHFPLDSNTLNYAEKSILCRQCLKLLTKRDWSLTRRLYQWIFNATNDFNTSTESLDLTYFTKYSRDNLISAVKDLLMAKGKTLDDVLVPIKIIVTFISDTDLAGITDKLMPALCIPILKYICKEHEEEEWRTYIIQETRLIFNPRLTPTSVIFESIIEEYNEVITSRHSKCSEVWYELLELSSVYLDEVCTVCICEAALCGLFMLLDNALSSLHRFSVEDDLYVVNHIMMYISTVFSRIEAIIRGECYYVRIDDNPELVDNEGFQINLLAEYQVSCSEKISHYLNKFYTEALDHFEQQADVLSAIEVNTIDALNELAVRFVAIEDHMAIVPVTCSLDPETNPDYFKVNDLNETYYPYANKGSRGECSDDESPLPTQREYAASTDGKRSSYPDACGIEAQKVFKLEKMVESLLRCTNSTNSQLFCRGIRTFIELLRLSNKVYLYNYITESGYHLRSIILKLWNSLDEKYVISHSEIVLLLLQLNSTIPSSTLETERVIVKDLTETDTDLKVSAMLRFGVLWRYAHIHAPEEEVFPEAIGCILDNIEESDPKLRYHSCSFLSESINVLSHLLDPILLALLSFDKIDPSSYSSCICDVLRKFRHLSSIVGREGRTLLDMMQRHQAPIHLLRLVQGKDTYNKMSESRLCVLDKKKIDGATNSSRDMDSSPCVDLVNENYDEECVPLITFPRLKDPLGSSYEDECIYDYVDLLVVITLKYICLNVNIFPLLGIKDLNGLIRYSEFVQTTEQATDNAIRENTMLFRCTAIDFMKLFLSSIQPTNRAKEVACLISRPLLGVLYHLHLKDETIIQTQLIYLLRVVMDRCHAEEKSVSKTTSELIHSARNISKPPLQSLATSTEKSSECRATDKLSDFDSTPNDRSEVKESFGDEFDKYVKIRDDELKSRMTYNMPQDSHIFRLEGSVVSDLELGDKVSRVMQDPFESKSNVLPEVYIMNVAAVKQAHLGNLKRLSDDDLFIHIIQLCIRNSAKFKRSHLLQSYIDFSVYNLKYISGNQSIGYASSFITEFCNQLNVEKDLIGITGVSFYLSGLYFMLSHISEKSINISPDLKSRIRFHSENGSCLFSLNSLLTQTEKDIISNVNNDGTSWQLFSFGMGSVKQKDPVITYDNEDRISFELSDVVDTCVQCLLWAKSSGNIHDMQTRDKGHTCLSTFWDTHHQDCARGTVRGTSCVYKHKSIVAEAVRLDIRMSIENISNEVLRLFRLLYARLPYHFIEGCLHLWDRAESSMQSREIKLEILSTINSAPKFSRSKMISYILDMLEPFAKSARYKDIKGYHLLNFVVRDSSVCEFIYALVASIVIPKKDIEATYEVLKRLVHFVLSCPRQPAVIVWVFHTICNFDKYYPSKDANVINKVSKKMLSDLMLTMIYQSVGLYMHKVCTWLPPKSYDLEPPLPVHILLINKHYYEQSKQRNCLFITGFQNMHSSCLSHRDNKNEASETILMDPLDCSCKNALAQLILFSYETGQLNRRTVITNIFFQVLCSNLSSHILPMLQGEFEPSSHYRYLILLLVRNLPFNLYDGSLYCIKKPIVDHINTPDFFKMDRRSFHCFASIFRMVVDEECKGTADRLIKLDMYTSPTHNSVFSSKLMNIQLRIKYLKRLAFVLYACRNDMFAKHTATIIERLTDNYRAHDDEQLKAKSLLAIRVLLVKMSQCHLTVLWPVLLSELIKIFDRERMALVMKEMNSAANSLNKTYSCTHIEEGSTGLSKFGQGQGDKFALLDGALKIVDVACSLRLNDFLIYQWMFADDFFDDDYAEKSDSSMEHSALDFKPSLTIVKQLYPEQMKSQLYDKYRLENVETFRENTQDLVDSSPDAAAVTGEEGELPLLPPDEEKPDEDVSMSRAVNTVDRRKLIREAIDLSIEDELLELDKSLIDLEPELNIHQIYKIYRKTL